MDADAGEYHWKDIYVIYNWKDFHIRVGCKLVQVQNWEYESGLLQVK